MPLILSKWKKTITNLISAQTAELQVLTINDSDGEMADYMVLNNTRKKGRSVARDFKSNQFYEKKKKPNSMRCGFKTNKTPTAVKKTDHTMTTPEGKIIHGKLTR